MATKKPKKARKKSVAAPKKKPPVRQPTKRVVTRAKPRTPVRTKPKVSATKSRQPGKGKLSPKPIARKPAPRAKPPVKRLSRAAQIAELKAEVKRLKALAKRRAAYAAARAVEEAAQRKRAKRNRKRRRDAKVARDYDKLERRAIQAEEALKRNIEAQPEKGSDEDPYYRKGGFAWFRRDGTPAKQPTMLRHIHLDNVTDMLESLNKAAGTTGTSFLRRLEYLAELNGIDVKDVWHSLMTGGGKGSFNKDFHDTAHSIARMYDVHVKEVYTLWFSP